MNRLKQLTKELLQKKNKKNTSKKQNIELDKKIEYIYDFLSNEINHIESIQEIVNEIETNEKKIELQLNKFDRNWLEMNSNLHNYIKKTVNEFIFLSKK